MKLADIQKVTVLGTGMMGPGIALLFARAGYETTIWGPNEGVNQKGQKNFNQNLDDLIRQKIITAAEGDFIHHHIRFSCDLAEAVKGTDFVSEAIIENLEIKQDIFAQMEPLCPATTILTSNTSTLLPSDINQKMKTSDRMLVAHFWNPAHLVPLVEVCGSNATAPEVIEVTLALLKKIGHKPVLLKKEILGFIGNRLMHAMNREALSLVEQGIATPEEVDQVVLASFGPRFSNLGPLEYLDFCGLDHILRIQEYLYADLANTAGSQKILQDKVRQGELGVKSGKGLFDWSTRDPNGPRLRRDLEFLRRIKEQKQPTAGEK